MQKQKLLRFAKYAATAFLATKLFFSSFTLLAEPPAEKAFLSGFAQYTGNRPSQHNIQKAALAAGIGAEYFFKNSHKSKVKSNLIEVGIFALAGKK